MNLRVIKKDVNYITDEIISDALLSMNFSQDEIKNEKIITIINEVLYLREETFNKINHPDKENIKSYYKNTIEVFLTSIDKLFDKLSTTIK